MPHKCREAIDWQQAQERINQARPDPETEQQTFCMIKATNAQLQVDMIIRSHINRSIVKPEARLQLTHALGRISADLTIIKTLIRSSIKES